jgi:hypothetical protein
LLLLVLVAAAHGSIAAPGAVMVIAMFAGPWTVLGARDVPGALAHEQILLRPVLLGMNGCAAWMRECLMIPTVVVPAAVIVPALATGGKKTTAITAAAAATTTTTTDVVVVVGAAATIVVQGAAAIWWALVDFPARKPGTAAAVFSTRGTAAGHVSVPVLVKPVP